MANVNLTYPDGSKKHFDAGITPLDIAKSIGPRLAKDTLAAKVDDELVDVGFKIEKDCAIRLITFKDPEGKEIFRHSAAHIFAYAIQELFPKAKNTIGPAVEEGFYYDFADLHITPEDFQKIEAKMKEIIKADLPCKRVEFSLDEVKKIFKDNKYKIEMATEFTTQGGKLSAYWIGDKFVDLCRGPHVPSTGIVKAIKLTQVAGAYWRGDQKNTQLTRIYGLAFPSDKEMEAHLKLLDEIEKRDHRKLGQELDLYATCEEIGPGLILWLPKGNIIKEELEKWAKETEEKWGYVRVTTPIVTKETLFYTSEHLPHYTASMFPPMKMENENYYIKPMNCPFHHMIFKARPKSYRELPLRVAEYGWCHRYEQSGACFGLMRVRGMQMNDAHIYCTKEQAVDEFVDVLRLHEYYYKALGIKEYSMTLALRDPSDTKYHGDEKMWKEAEELTRAAMEKSGIPFTVTQGGAAFYGPKMDFEIKSAIGREFSASTCQLDLFMPTKFGLTYMGEDGKEHTPVCIHRAPLGTHERFVGFLIEHFAGKFPLWLSPEQVRILSVSEKTEKYAQEVHKDLRDAGIRAELNCGNETLNKKIRDAQLAQINYILVVGEKEQVDGTVNIRTRDNVVHGTKKVDVFLKEITEEIALKK